jgi:hypothetical protein
MLRFVAVPKVYTYLCLNVVCGARVVHARNIRSRITIGIIGGLLLENCGTVEVTLTLKIAM